MSLARLTTVGLFMYDNSLFDELVAPTKLDRDILVKNILQKSAPFELLLTDFNFLKMSIGLWSAKNIDNWNAIIDAFTMDYNPIENYDRFENWSDSASESESESTSSSELLSTSESETVSESSSDSMYNSLTSTNDVSAYDTIGYQPNERNINDNRGNNNSVSNQNRGNQGRQDRNTLEGHNRTHERLDTHGGRIHGNIGVTTTQQMLLQEFDLRQINMYDEIAKSFCKEFCLLIY